MSSFKPSHQIGLLSGIGPLAGSDILNKIYKYSALKYGAIEDCEYPDLILINHGIEGVDNLGTVGSKFESELVEGVNKLELAGAGVMGIACNTAHLYLNKIKLADQTRLVNLIEAVSVEAAEVNVNYLLLTSNTSKKQQLYPSYLKNLGVKFNETTAGQQKLLDDTIGLVMSYELEKAEYLLSKLLDKALDDGVQGIIIGCTELPIVFNSAVYSSKFKVHDSNQILAEKLVDSYYMKKSNEV